VYNPTENIDGFYAKTTQEDSARFV
jgi:hypothetical protein